MIPLKNPILKASVAAHGLQRSLQGKGPRPVLVHMHVMKSAGSSVNAYLKRCFGSYNTSPAGVLIKDNWLNDGPCEEAMEKAKHAAYITGHFSWDLMTRLTAGRNCFVFTILRAPSDRLRSLYNFMRFKTTPKGDKRAERLYDRVRAMTPLQFLTCEDPELSYLRDNVMTRQFSGSFSNIEVNNELVDRAAENLSMINHIGFMGRLSHDLNHVLQCNDIPSPRVAPRINVTGAADRGIIRQWDPECIEALENCIHWDQKLYAFALGHTSETSPGT